GTGSRRAGAGSLRAARDTAGEQLADIGRRHVDARRRSGTAAASAAAARAEPTGVLAAVAGLHLADARLGADAGPADHGRRHAAVDHGALAIAVLDVTLHAAGIDSARVHSAGRC